MATGRPDWVIGFEDETWWSRFAWPAVSSWSAAGHPLRLVEQTPVTGDPDPKALACYGLLVASPADPEWAERVWLRFVDGRPVSAITTQFLAWCGDRLTQAGKRVWVLIWDNASWHISRAVRTWIRTHNRAAKRTGQGVRIIMCPPSGRAGQESLAEPHGTALDPCQEAHRRTGASVECP